MAKYAIKVKHSIHPKDDAYISFMSERGVKGEHDILKFDSRAEAEVYAQDHELPSYVVEEVK